MIEPPVSAQPEPSPYLRVDPDLDALADNANTRLERLYYRHAGRHMFKWQHYLPLYDRALTPFVGQPITILEIGVSHGGSLQLWRNFFGAKAKIIGVDIEPVCLNYGGPGIEIVIGDQGDRDFLEGLASQFGPFDVVIDDGGHINADQILTLETLFPHVKVGGVYVCEDLHTSYWPGWGGGLDRPDTFIGHFKTILDRLHGRYYGAPLAREELANWIDYATVADSIIFFHKREPIETAMVAVG